ncbi:hypothetical protein P0E69_06670 [Chimaeribacter arupi]|uniref:hypothetical protein n=1 Tax=Chimaeribacter arupi TaxID=2060066 RepID=UPI0027121901|nr:hypothetical protein [Chimaeribacter arupi]WKZ93571.1 hypothetical protein P0E69_06670 [Chimaeribacter arupi]
MTDKQPAPVGDCHIVGKAVVPEDFGQLEAEAKRLQELMVSASMECAGKQQEALAEAMEAYLKVSTPSVMLSLLRQNAELKAERDALAGELSRLRKQKPMAQVAESFIFFLRRQDSGECWPVGTKLYTEPRPTAPVVKVPDELTHEAAMQLFFGKPVTAIDVWNACRAEVLKINSEPEGIIKSNSAKN